MLITNDNFQKINDVYSNEVGQNVSLIFAFNSYGNGNGLNRSSFNELITYYSTQSTLNVNSLIEYKEEISKK